RPADATDVVAQHPERRPHTLPARDLHAGLEVPVGLGESAGSVEPGRGELAPAVPAVEVARILPPGGDHQVALAVQRGVAGAVGVPLPLVVVDVVAGLGEPAAAVDRTAGRAVEIV